MISVCWWPVWGLVVLLEVIGAVLVLTSGYYYYYSMNGNIIRVVYHYFINVLLFFTGI